MCSSRRCMELRIFAVRRSSATQAEEASARAALRTLWEAGTPYIHWRMPWIGYEYWDPESPEDERFLGPDAQAEMIGQTVGAFAKLFASLPRSACAPGYRANDDTHRAWAQHGIHVAQNGPGTVFPPHFDRYNVLHLSRTVEFEPATDPAFSVEACLRQAEICFERGIPAIVSLHSINFHSTVRISAAALWRRWTNSLLRLNQSIPICCIFTTRICTSW